MLSLYLSGTSVSSGQHAMRPGNQQHAAAADDAWMNVHSVEWRPGRVVN